jgi:hypothetical protein
MEGARVIRPNYSAKMRNCKAGCGTEAEKARIDPHCVARNLTSAIRAKLRAI